MYPNFCEILESEYSVTTEALVGQKFRTVCQVWLEAFFPNVKRNTGHLGVSRLPMACIFF